MLYSLFCFFFFFNDTATTEIYTLSLHDALPISSSFADQLRSRAPEPDAHPHGFVSGEYAETSFQKLIDGKVFRPLESLVKNLQILHSRRNELADIAPHQIVGEEAPLVADTSEMVR